VLRTVNDCLWTVEDCQKAAVSGVLRTVDYFLWTVEDRQKAAVSGVQKAAVIRSAEDSQ
jgi:hypothetical protein